VVPEEQRVSRHLAEYSHPAGSDDRACLDANRAVPAYPGGRGDLACLACPASLGVLACRDDPADRVCRACQDDPGVLVCQGVHDGADDGDASASGRGTKA